LVLVHVAVRSGRLTAELALNFLHSPLPAFARMKQVRDSKSDGDRDERVRKADGDELRALACRNPRAQEGVEDGEQYERRGEGLEEGDDEHSELAEGRGVDAGPLQRDPRASAERDADENANVEGNFRFSIFDFRLGRGWRLDATHRIPGAGSGRGRGWPRLPRRGEPAFRGRARGPSH